MTTSSRMLSPSEEIAATDVVAARGLCAREEANPDHWLPNIVDRPPNPDRLRRARARADRQCRVGAENGKAQCPARTACLLLAVGRGEKHGIWGGLIPADLTALAKDPEQLEALLNDYRADDVEADGSVGPQDTGGSERASA
ncbi:WhiB family transcriptional regulator [Nocardioides speluncae]|uniref:WhiB family transcriptional regulator n=1 Tax=Nocardioides speluncae TaxID=2670337 RepID=UPI0012B18516|nr:WhiB family transcriptional regulator [Nocardioides speluncae]